MNKEIMHSLDEVTLLPSSIPSTIQHRADVDPFVHDEFMQYWVSSNEKESKMLPIFCSPMTTIVDFNNLYKYLENGITPILPRSSSLSTRLQYSNNFWVSVSLQEFSSIINDGMLDEKNHMLLIDIADGHISKLYNLIEFCKKLYPNTILMVGNIDHPSMYVECCKAGVDYVRVGIGGGSVCSTSIQTGVHASHVWMAKEIRKIQDGITYPTNKDLYYNGIKLKTITKTIADGGINSVDKIVKCLALGYDYVMLGSMFAHCIEACGETRMHITTYHGDNIYLTHNHSDELFSVINGQISRTVLERKYYGMSSEQGQIDISGGICKHSEGLERWVPVDITLKELTKNIEAALRSAMSYTYSNNLKELKECEWTYQSPSEYSAYYCK